MISEFIFYDEAGSKEDKSVYINLKVQIRTMLKDEFKRKTISEILLELRKDVSGATQQRLFELFQDLDLHQDSYKKLESWRWEHISSGIQELTRMQVHEAYGFLTKFVNDKRSTIRKQAEIALVTLNPKGINYFLDTTRNKISEWQQLKLIEVLSNKEDFKPPNFKSWLVSKNKYVVLFSLRLIKFYDQNDANPSIIELVKHRDDQIKQEAIDCIKAFHLSAALPTLKHVFWKSSTDIKIAILDVIGTMGSSKELHFLESIAKKESNYSVTSKALGAINTIVPDSVLPTEGISDISQDVIPDDIVDTENDLCPPTAISISNSLTDEKTLEGLAISHIEEIAKKPAEESKIARNPESRKTSNTDAIDVNSIEVEFSVAFLPLVIDAKNDTNESQKRTEEAINDIEVVWENVNDTTTSFTKSENLTAANLLASVADLDFLPLVVADKFEKTKMNDINELEVIFEQVAIDETSAADQKEIDVNDIDVRYEVIEVVVIAKELELVLEDIEVVFEEIIPEKVEISFEMDEESNEFIDFEINFKNGQPPLQIPKINLAELTDIEILEFEVLNVTPNEGDKNKNELPQWLLNEISKENTNSNNSERLDINNLDWKAKEAQMMDKLQDYFSKMSGDEFSNDEDTDDITQTLDDIELFGDEREISLLQELLYKAENAQTNKRINELMKRFMGTDVYNKNKINVTTYSVFEELFRNCDTESKLILLDEIIMIGNEKEIPFLEKLAEDSEKVVRTQASLALKKINERLARIASGKENEDDDEYIRFINLMELKPPKEVVEPSYLHIDFEIGHREQEMEEGIKPKKQENKLFDFFSDFIAKRIKKAS
ncbi:HEAT repeat domain-containing protein [bacterium]|nr:HEAT repeat domain-containing protein [bacterium]